MSVVRLGLALRCCSGRDTETPVGVRSRLPLGFAYRTEVHSQQCLNTTQSSDHLVHVTGSFKCTLLHASCTSCRVAPIGSERGRARRVGQCNFSTAGTSCQELGDCRKTFQYLPGNRQCPIAPGCFIVGFHSSPSSNSDRLCTSVCELRSNLSQTLSGPSVYRKTNAQTDRNFFRHPGGSIPRNHNV